MNMLRTGNHGAPRRRAVEEDDFSWPRQATMQLALHCGLGWVFSFDSVAAVNSDIVHNVVMSVAYLVVKVVIVPSCKAVYLHASRQDSSGRRVADGQIWCNKTV